MKKLIAVVSKSSDDFVDVYEIICESINEALELEDKLFYESECCNTCVNTSWHWKCEDEEYLEKFLNLL